MRIIGAALAATARVDAFLLWDSADGRVHLKAIVQNCHREEGALRLTRRSCAVGWAAVPGVEA